MGNTLRIIGSTLVGIALGVVVSQQLLSGYLAQWYQIAPPERIARFVTLRNGDLWAQTESGNVYHCRGIECEREATAPETPNDYELIRPCFSERSTLSPSTHPPASIVECQESVAIFSREAYALDRNRNLWFWRATGLNSELFWIGWCSIPVGAMLGFAIGLIWSRRMSGKNQSGSNADPQFIAADSLPHRRKKVRKVVQQ